MFLKFFNIFRFFKGHHYKKFIKNGESLIVNIKQHAERLKDCTEAQYKEKTAEFKQRYQAGESLDELLPEAFALVREAAKSLVGKTFVVCDQHLKWNMVHHDVQLLGGIALHRGMVAEMGTGEGKTLVATLPLYLNALSGKNCQLITVNDYLARRDSQWMSGLFKLLGLSVGCIQHGMRQEDRKIAYGCDITYGTASEFGFDYLRDNGMALQVEDQAQRGHHFCIIDEADSILIDEARTPLIISGEAEEQEDMPFHVFKKDIERLVDIQQKLCNRLALEAKTVLESEGDKHSQEAKDALTKLLQVRLGAPKNKQLLRLMEVGTIRKQFEKFDLEMHSDFNRDQLYALKEELFFTIDERQQQADLTEKGRTALQPNNPDAFTLPDLPLLLSQLDSQLENETLSLEAKQRARLKLELEFKNISETIHCLSQLLRAYCLYEKDVHYVIQEGKVVIVDENTGRAMPGRRWNEGLHQAIECKEGVKIEKESKTYASITLQNYFRLYQKLAGMTGTALTEAAEFFDIYKMLVMPIPPHRPCIRQDLNDLIYKTRREKYQAVLEAIENAHKAGQPVLVGTTSVEASELLDKMLKRANIPHTVLNAKFHQQEAEIIAKAGEKGSVTIATNMAGRGTDIKLGEGVKELGGLFVIGTERHESRRIDNQLLGRSARQGDPGLSRFFISLEDDLMRLFVSGGAIGKILEKSFSENEALEHSWINRSVAKAQEKVEQQNYDIRKRLLQYDDVLNKQRLIIYGLRKEAIQSQHAKELLFDMLEEELSHQLNQACPPTKSLDAEGLHAFLTWVNTCFPLGIQEGELQGLSREALLKTILDYIHSAYEEKEAVETPETLRRLESFVLLRFIDKNWQDHLTEMEGLRRSVSLRGYGQKDPLNEYKTEAFTLFEDMMLRIREEVCRNIFRSASSADSLRHILFRITRKAQHGLFRAFSEYEASRSRNPSTINPQEPKGLSISLPKTPLAASTKAGRNDPCPCQSGKKYKKCCGARD